jgi:uncharacterized protein involved in outer membrane biogenesis
MIFSLRNALTAERVGGDDIGTGFEVFAINIRNYLGVCQVQLVAVTHLAHHGTYHGSHTAIQYENSLFYDLV